MYTTFVISCLLNLVLIAFNFQPTNTARRQGERLGETCKIQFDINVTEIAEISVAKTKTPRNEKWKRVITFRKKDKKKVCFVIIHRSRFDVIWTAEFAQDSCERLYFFKNAIKMRPIHDSKSNKRVFLSQSKRRNLKKLCNVLNRFRLCSVRDKQS